MAGYIGWHDLNFGTRNAWDGEADIARNLLVWVGVPVAFIYRGGFHRINPNAVQDPKHLARLRQFCCDYFGWTPEYARKHRDAVDIPLKRQPLLGWMSGLVLLVWLAGAGMFIGLVGLIVLLTDHRKMARGDLVLLWVGIGAFVAFGGLLAGYLRLRRPSRRQAGIRAATLRRVGTYADLADWKTASLGPLFPHLGIVSLEPGDVLAEAETLRGAGKDEEALVRARIVVAFAHPREDALLIERAEVLTDECLQRLEGTGV
jgi:hypothetical protein